MYICIGKKITLKLLGWRTYNRGNKMRYTYYLQDSTIFANAEDMLKALYAGATIINDDADVKFAFDRPNGEVWLVATDKFTGKSFQSGVHLYRADVVADMMDRAVDTIIATSRKYFDLF